MIVSVGVCRTSVHKIRRRSCFKATAWFSMKFDCAAACLRRSANGVLLSVPFSIRKFDRLHLILDNCLNSLVSFLDCWGNRFFDILIKFILIHFRTFVPVYKKKMIRFYQNSTPTMTPVKSLMDSNVLPGRNCIHGWIFLRVLRSSSHVREIVYLNRFELSTRAYTGMICSYLIIIYFSHDNTRPRTFRKLPVRLFIGRRTFPEITSIKVIFDELQSILFVCISVTRGIVDEQYYNPHTAWKTNTRKNHYLFVAF